MSNVTWSAEWWEANARPIIQAYGEKGWWAVLEALAGAPAAYVQYIKSVYERSPEHVIIETFLIVFILYISFVKKSKLPKQATDRLTPAEIQQLCDEWQPEPIVEAAPAQEIEKVTYNLGIVEGTPGTHIKLRGINQPVINMGTLDFLGMASRPEIKNVAHETLIKYGCGSCGPRGFYGTIDTHEILEKNIAKFIGTTDTITISDIEATASSVLPAFAKRGDLIVIDEGVNDSLLVGINLSRCTTYYYKHNDLEDLERVLKSVRDADKKAGRRSDCQRRYLVTEGLFRNYGDILPLPQVLALTRKYFFRLFVDESFSFGVLGATGKGITEHYNLPIDSIDIICGSLCSSLAGVGGFSTGSQHVVDYQRINSAGYVFSASAPPYTSAVTSEAIRLLTNEPKLLESLKYNAKTVHQVLSSSAAVKVLSDPESPVVHVRLANSLLSQATADKVVEQCLAKGVAVVASHYKTSPSKSVFLTIRLTVNAQHSKEHITTACRTVVAALEAVSKLPSSDDTQATTDNGLRKRK
ncbi:serine palmitoyltransferase [Thraustotheca clavata]|uniref:serine C-palmitoyltransferase n=1 Tax=Thraustotheca clavata TaxID=74557 RepID=A0A1V9ZC05_9STRA|nr:serine palmitoyltransferase [Thraustotheca clavata]